MTNNTHITPHTLDKLRTLGVTTINFSSDNLDRPQSLKSISSHFDACWVTEPEAVIIMKDFGANPIHLPMAADPNIFLPISTKEKYDISFCGAKNSSRPFYIYKILENTSLSMAVGGSGWSNSRERASARSVADPLYTLRYIANNITFKEGRRNILADAIHILREPQPSIEVQNKLSKFLLPVLSFPKYIQLYSETRVSLGFNERGNTWVLPKPVFHHRLRDFEAPMSGACYLMRRLPEMLEYYSEDKEMLFYSSLDELLEKAAYYSRPEKAFVRQRIRIAARKRSLRDHTWENRLQKLFKFLKLKSEL